ncbi:MAG: exlusion protein FxsA [Hydrogenophilales bacterium CG_4_9_14_3_um_filter_59_35]|nr:MAG: exlusion protein FxsA [Hydrogenophilales bacterium CG18_big_fil_WC_8_21_14_2_50_58_12]PIX99513.1 MAG: exlusion protein FxsA [Hydrogenophilales bacterium CG_4_10_14_3_um_filter_58_23]PJB05430.1 MAG: exlusion protein FxsA [Hydrogenophilales bacterium CG_4_9_14_3_um_filter_59_35]
MRTLLILLILLGFPALEIYVLAKLAGTIGWWLVPWLLSSAVVGGWLVREAGARVPLQLFAALQSGHSLGFSMLIGFRTVLAGLLLIFPGVVSDFLALILLLLPHPKNVMPTAANDDVIDGEWTQVNEHDKLPRK